LWTGLGNNDEADECTIVPFVSVERADSVEEEECDAILRLSWERGGGPGRTQRVD
jgi:hypothetical protein